MAANKCVNCGANIPKGAAFCPSCGAPKAAEQPAPVPQPQPVAPAPPPQPVSSGPGGLQGFIDFTFSLKIMLVGFFIAVLVAWITRLVNQFLVAGTVGFTAVNIVNFTFMTGAGGLLIFGGLLNEKLNVYIRAALMVTGGVFIALNI